MKHNVLLIGFVILIVVYGTICFASIKGRVTDTEGHPVSGAQVTFIDEIETSNKFKSLTDSDGRYVIDLTISVDEIPDAYANHGDFTLYQNYPNPFNPSTVISFTLDKAGFVELYIYNVLGQKIRTLINSRESAGFHYVIWNGLDDGGNSVGAGIFIYLLRCGEHVESRKMLLLDGSSSPLSIQGNTAFGSVISHSDFSTHSPAKMAEDRMYTVKITGKDLLPFESIKVFVTAGEEKDFVIKRVQWPVSGFVPGAIFREYRWGQSTSIRATDPEATNSGAKNHLPNPKHYITIDDLSDAVKAEVTIELLQSHAGTYDKRIRLNGNEWLSIPEAVNIPGTQFRGGQPECFQTMRYPTVEIPLSHLISGKNTFEFTNGGQTCHNFGWGQFIVYGVIFRIYYAESKEHPTGRITSPSPGSTIGENPTITATASSPAGIKMVYFIGYYEDFNYEGENIWRQWHYNYRYGAMQHHLGRAISEPYSIVWDTEWVTDQEFPIKIMARITDSNYMHYLTEPVEDIQFAREDRSVRLYKPYYIPQKWVSRMGWTHTCTVNILDDLSKATGAIMMLYTWEGYFTDSIGINDKEIAPTLNSSGLSYHQLGVPLDFLQSGLNRPYTFSSTSHHGVEVQWPGIALKVAYKL